MAQDFSKHEALSNINPQKLELLQSFLSQGNHKSPNEMMSVLMAASAASKKKGLQFTPEEIEQIIAVVRMGKSPTEQAKIEKMMRMIQMMSPKR